MSWPLRRPLWARLLLAMLLCMVLPHGSLAVKCNDPVVENGEKLSGFEPLYTNSSVTFECKIGYFMIGSYVTRCDENGTWNPSVPTCKKIAPHLCGAPLIPTGSVHPLKPEYNLEMSIVVLCNPQYCFPDETIEMAATCKGYNTWEPPVYPCYFRTSPDTCTLSIPNGKIVRGKKRQYEPGDKITIQCHAGYALKGSSVIRYIGGKKWLPKIPYCSLSFFFILLIIAKTCERPGPLDNGVLHADSIVPIIGSVVSFVCIRGFRLVGHNTIKCVLHGTDAVWNTSLPRCELVMCEDPVVEHGVKLSGFGHSHTYGNNITYECKIGYFMIGSYLIQCEENSAWNPAVPSCKQINPKSCGAPIIPNGRVNPLKPQYQLEETIVVQCNSQYSFPDETIETLGVCQGYNLWDPPVPPCVFRTSPDIVQLPIHHGEIISGKKGNYEPGDIVTIHCYAGYTLIGSPKTRYIGGKQWFPKIPSCSLNFVFVLLIAACLLVLVVLPAKMVYVKYRSQ